MTEQRLRVITSVLWCALILLCLAWEGWLAPLRPGGSWLTLKALPLLLPLFGILHGRRYTYQWACMFVLLYFVEGVIRANDPNGVALYARIEIALTVAVFTTLVLYARLTAPSRQRKAG